MVRHVPMPLFLAPGEREGRPAGARDVTSPTADITFVTDDVTPAGAIDGVDWRMMPPEELAALAERLEDWPDDFRQWPVYVRSGSVADLAAHAAASCFSMDARVGDRSHEFDWCSVGEPIDSALVACQPKAIRQLRLVSGDGLTMVIWPGTKRIRLEDSRGHVPVAERVDHVLEQMPGLLAAVITEPRSDRLIELVFRAWYQISISIHEPHRPSLGQAGALLRLLYYEGQLVCVRLHNRQLVIGRVDHIDLTQLAVPQVVLSGDDGDEDRRIQVQHIHHVWPYPEEGGL